jgi:hypothetical protein
MKALQERAKANLREMKAELRANNKMFEVLQGTLVFRMDVHQARTRVTVAGAGAIQQPRGRGTAAVRSRYQKTGEETAG